MKIKLSLALFLLLSMVALHLSASQYAVDCEEICEERHVGPHITHAVIH